MKIEKIIHENVNHDGTFTDKMGSICVNGLVRMSHGEGCGIPNCNCSPGYWMLTMMPLKDGKVEGMRVEFESAEEMDKYLEQRQLEN